MVSLQNIPLILQISVRPSECRDQLQTTCKMKSDLHWNCGGHETLLSFIW